MQVVPVDVSWSHSLLRFKVHFLQLPVVPQNTVQLLFAFKCKESSDNIRVICELFLLLNLVFQLEKGIVILNLDCCSSALKQIEHLGVIIDKVNPCYLGIFEVRSDELLK